MFGMKVETVGASAIESISNDRIVEPIAMGAMQTQLVSATRERE